MFGISSGGGGGGSPSHCFPLDAVGTYVLASASAPFSRSVLFIADKHSLVSSSRDRGGGGGEALVIRVRSRRRVD